MGEFAVKAIKSNAERSAFYKYMLRDLEAFEIMLKENLIESRDDMIGAEQEICIVDKMGQPDITAMEILKDINDPHYTNELALYNLEINLDPKLASGKSFSAFENEVLHFLKIGRKASEQYGSQLFLTGILPSLNFRHLFSNYMTPVCTLTPDDCLEDACCQTQKLAP